MRRVVLFAAMMLCGCASSLPSPTPQQSQSPTDVRPLTATEKAALRKTLASGMKNPDTTQFRWMPVASVSGSATADYCALINGKPFRAVINRNSKGEFDSGKIVRIQEDDAGSDAWVTEDVNKNMRDFCQRAGYSDFSQAH
jgi:PBP1b-binding outer membrane lipoprotein LpoB